MKLITYLQRSASGTAIAVSIASIAVAEHAWSDNIGLVADSYVVNEGGQSFSVIDLYIDFPVGTYALWSAFNANISLSGASA